MSSFLQEISARATEATSALARAVPVAALLLGIACAFAPPGARAQSSILSSGPDPLASTTVSRAEALRAIDASYLHALTERLERAREAAGDDRADFEAAPYLQRSRERFLVEAGAKLLELQGDDGALTHAEIREDLPQIRERHLNRFRDVAEARAAGHRPPPLAGEYDAGWRFAADLAIYTLGIRNEPLEWARLALAMLAGLIVGLLLKRGLDLLGDGTSSGLHATLENATDSIRVPLYLAATLVGLRVGLDVIWLPRAVERFVRGATEIAIVGLLLWAAWKLCTVLAGSIAVAVEGATGTNVGTTGRLVIKRVLHVGLLVGAFLLVTRVAFDASLVGMLTSLGVIGVALWFVMRSVIDNLTASFTLFSDRPFRVGDILIHDDVWVTVEDVGFRSTRLRSFDGHLFTVPNSIMAEHPIRNVSARPSVRHRFRIGVLYSTPPEKLDEAIGIVESIFESMGGEIDLEAGAHVVFERYGDYDLKLLVQYYTATDDYWAAHETNSRFNRELLGRFNEAGIGFAFPTQTTVLEAEEDALPGLGQALREGIDTGVDRDEDEDGGGNDAAGRGDGEARERARRSAGDGPRDSGAGSASGGREGRHDGGVEADGLEGDGDEDVHGTPPEDDAGGAEGRRGP